MPDSTSASSPEDHRTSSTFHYPLLQDNTFSFPVNPNNDAVANFPHFVVGIPQSQNFFSSWPFETLQNPSEKRV